MSLYRMHGSEDFDRPARYLYVGRLEVTERIPFRGWQELALP